MQLPMPGAYPRYDRMDTSAMSLLKLLAVYMTVKDQLIKRVDE